LIFLEEFDGVQGLVSIQSLGELMDRRGDLESLHNDSLLSLESDIFGQSHESGKISLWLDVSSNSEISWGFFEKGVSLSFDFLSFGSFSLGFSGLSWHC